MATETVKRAQKKCFDRFSEFTLPKKQKELLDACTLLPQELTIDQNSLQAVILPECRNSFIVLVNGCFVPELSSLTALTQGCTVLPLASAFRTYSTLLLNAMQKTAKESSNPMQLLNAAMAENGICVLLAPKYVAVAPLQIISIVNAVQAPIYSRMYLFAASFSEITIVNTKLVLNAENCFYNQAVEVVCEENAKVVMEEVYTSEKRVDFFEHVQAVLKRSSTFSSTFVTNTSSTHREMDVALSGENAEADCNGVWCLAHSQAIETRVTMEHKEPHCRSMQLFKGVLQDSATSNFEGKIQVRQKAQKTESYQLNKNLLLSEGAKARCTPNLEICADDVKASHGATMGKLDEEHLFYFKSRGISEKDAKDFLVRGFCEEVLAKLTLPSLQEKGYQLITTPYKNE